MPSHTTHPTSSLPSLPAGLSDADWSHIQGVIETDGYQMTQLATHAKAETPATESGFFSHSTTLKPDAKHALSALGRQLEPSSQR